MALNWRLGRPIGCNETGFDGQDDATYRVQGWDFILAGGALYNNLDYSFAAGFEDGTYSYPPEQPGGGSPTLRRQLGILREFMDRLDFIRMGPASHLVRATQPEAAAARLLAWPGRQYALYVHQGRVEKHATGARYRVDAAPRTTSLEIELPAGGYRIEWLDTKTGAWVDRYRLRHAGGWLTVTTPQYSEDIGARILRR